MVLDHALSDQPPVVLDGYDLRLADVCRVARCGAPVRAAAQVPEAMARARAVAQAVIARGEPAYGVTTGLGVRKRNRIAAWGHDDLVLRQHLIGQGGHAPPEVVRATALLLANTLSRAVTSARPVLLDRVLQRLNDDRLPPVRLLGSLGEADLSAMADLAVGLFDDLPLAQGEACAVLNHSCFATGWAALAIADTLELLDALDLAAGLSMEAIAASPDLLDPVITRVRAGSGGLRVSHGRMAAVRSGSRLPRRQLQDPLTFRQAPQIHGAARDAVTFAAATVERELNATQSNPLVLADPAPAPYGTGRVISTGTCETLGLAMALDATRVALGAALTGSAERAVKLLQATHTGLPEGLAVQPGMAECALSEYGIAVQALVAEARLLTAPVCLEVPSTTQAEGVEDRTSMAPLAARRLAEMLRLGRLVGALELTLAAQGCELRRRGLGGVGEGRAVSAALRDGGLAPGARRLLSAIRRGVPFVDAADLLPDLEPLVQALATGELVRDFDRAEVAA